MNKLLILDKDGTIARSESCEFVQNPTDQVVLPGVEKAILRYQCEGWRVVIASNQGGIESGHKTMDDEIAEMRYCMKLTGIDYAYFCPDFAGEKVYRVAKTGKPATPGLLCPFRSGFRKPEPGMLHLAMYDFKPYKAEWVDVLMVGDMWSDRLAATKAGVRFMQADSWRGV